MPGADVIGVEQGLLLRPATEHCVAPVPRISRGLRVPCCPATRRLIGAGSAPGDGQTGRGSRRDSGRPRLPGRLDRPGTPQRFAERLPLTARPRPVGEDDGPLLPFSDWDAHRRRPRCSHRARAPALMTALVDHLRIHRGSNASLDVLPLGLTHPAQYAHQHLVRGVATIEPATELSNPDIEAVRLEARCSERELVAEPAAGAFSDDDTSQPRRSSRSWLSRADAASLRSHGTDRDCPISENSAAMWPPSGSTNFVALLSCQARGGLKVLVVFGGTPAVEGQRSDVSARLVDRVDAHQGVERGPVARLLHVPIPSLGDHGRLDPFASDSATALNSLKSSRATRVSS